MENKKRAIILDMDETLEHGTIRSAYNAGDGAMMTLRPNLDELISKLQEAKNQGIDIILCTTAQEQWVERFLILKPEFRTIFNKILTRDNEKDWKYFDKETNPLEHKASYELDFEKPVTTFGYDSVLFIDDNRAEANRLKSLFEMAQGKLEKDVTYFSGFGFNGETLPLNHILCYKKASSQNTELAQKLEEYLKTERDNPGCHMMCSVIDSFMSKEFTPGLTLKDEEHYAEYDLFHKKLSSFRREFAIIKTKLEKQTGKKLIEHTDNEIAELRKYLDTDKSYPYEGIEIKQPEKSKREKLSELVQTARDMRTRLDEVQKLKDDYQQLESKETEL